MMPFTKFVKTLIDTLAHRDGRDLPFPRSFRSVLVRLSRFPISLIGALFLMPALRFLPHLLTLLAIVLSVGLVVDDASLSSTLNVTCGEGLSRMNGRIGRRARTKSRLIIAMTITLAASTLRSRYKVD